MLAGSSGTHTVCVCTHHQNIKLMFNGSKLSVLSNNTITHCRHCLATIMCNPSSIDCFMSHCKHCPGTQAEKHNRHHVIDSIQYQQWTTTDPSNLITVVQQVDEFWMISWQC